MDRMTTRHAVDLAEQEDEYVKLRLDYLSRSGRSLIEPVVSKRD